MRNIAYTTGENTHPRHVLDIYAPEGVNDYPTLMFVSGGGWTSGSKDWITHVGATFAAQGIGVAIVDHRLMPEVTYAQQVEDLARAFAWLKENIGTYGGDPARIIVGGHSAGSHLVSLMVVDNRYLEAVGYQLSDMVAVLCISAAFDVRDFFAGSDDVEAASPINYVRAGLPPFLLLFAESDLPGIATQAKAMKAALESFNVLVESAMIPHRDHFDIVHQIGAPSDTATQIMCDWMMTVLETKI